MKIKIKIPISLFIMLNFSCENLSDPGEIEIKNSVFINLTVNSKQKFYIYNTVDFETITRDEFDLSSFDKYFVDNAVISLTDSITAYNNFIIDRDSSNNRYYTFAENKNFKTDTRYTFLINSNGQNIIGSTITPGDFNIISPLDNQVIHLSENNFNIEVRWNKSKNSKGYLLNVSYQYYDEYLNRYLPGSVEKIIFDDTTYSFSSFVVPTDSVSIAVMAFDENYFNHIFGGKNRSGIEGAYGYFGSSVLHIRKVWVK